MSFEDDEYWEEQYSDRSGVASAVARDRYAEPNSPPPFRGARGGAGPVVRTSTWDGEIESGPDAPDIDLDPPDELAARRRRRSRSGPPPARTGSSSRSTSSRDGFDNARPDWLNDPDFVPTDVSAPDLAGPDSDVLDFNRPELGANFDNPEFSAPAAPRGGPRSRRAAPDYSDPDFVHGYGDGYDDAQYAADLAREAARHAEPRDRYDGGRVRFDDGGYADDRGGLGDGRGGLGDGRGGARGYADERGARPDRFDDHRYADDRGFAEDRGQPGDRGYADDRGQPGDRAAEPGERGRARRGPAAPDRGQARPIRADRSRVSVDGVDDGPISRGGQRADFPRPEVAGRAPEQVSPDRLPVDRVQVERVSGDGVSSRPGDGDRPGEEAYDGPIRPPGGRRGRRSAEPQGRPAPRDDRQFPPPPPAAPAASGRARVPVPPIAEPAPDDALDLYRPPRDGDSRRDEPRAPAAFAAPGQAPATRPDAGVSKVPGASENPGAPKVPGEEASGGVRKPPQPTTPRVISKAAPPATPKVIKKADPPATPRVIKVEPPTAPARVVPANPLAPGPVNPLGSGPSDRPDIAASDRPGTTPADRPGVSPADRPGIPPADRPGVAASASPDGQTWAAPDAAVPQSPAGGPPAQAYPGSPIEPQPGSAGWSHPEKLRAAPLPGVPAAQGRSPVRSAGEPPAPDTQRRPDAATFFGPSPSDTAGRPARSDDTAGQTAWADHTAGRPAWADDTPVAGTPRVAPADLDRRPQSGRPTPSPAAPRPEPMPINGAIPRRIDAPAPRPPGHRAAPAQQPAAAHHDVDQQPPAVAARHAVAADAPAWQPFSEQNPSVAEAADHHAPTMPASGAPAGVAPQPTTPDNPVPIARLATSGPDTTERHYADADLGATWFTAKTPAAPEPTQSGTTDPGSAPAAAHTSGGAPATDRARTGSDQPGPQQAGLPQAGSSQTGDPRTGPPRTDTPQTGTPQTGTPQTGSPQTRTPQAGSPHGGGERAGTTDSGQADGGTAVDVGPTRPIPRQAAAPAQVDVGPTHPIPRLAAPAQAVDEPASVVIDLDITGLINGLGMTSEQPAVATGAGDADSRTADAGAADDAGREAPAPGEVKASAQREVSLMPGQPPAEFQPAAHALAPLSAEDLEAIRWRLDGGTLREVVDDRDALRELGGRLDEPLAEEQDNVARAGLLSVRAEVYRLLGELGLAAAASRLALAHAEAAGDVQSIVIAQAELAHVLRLRGDFAEADRLFEEAASSESSEVLRSVVHENAGRSCFDQGRQMEALDHFARAIRLGAPDDLDLVERIDVCLEAVYIHVLRDGWGPYPRLRREILSPVRTPSPAAAPTASRANTLA